MARVKLAKLGFTNTAVMKPKTLYPADESPVVLGMPDKAALGSPCPSPSSRKRKRTTLASAIRIVPQCPSTPATVELHEDGLTSYGFKSDRDETMPHIELGELHDRSENPYAWRYFSLNICSCMDAHSLHTYAIPATGMRNWSDLESAVESITNTGASTGTFTDLEGNEIHRLSEMFADCLACGLRGLIWHEAYFADVEMGDKRLAQQRVKECLARQRNRNRSNLSRRSGQEADRHHARDFVDGHSIEQVTPPPPRLTTVKSPSLEPWTAQTSSSGRVTELQSCNKSSIIKHQQVDNIFDDQPTWPMTPVATSEAATLEDVS